MGAELVVQLEALRDPRAAPWRKQHKLQTTVEQAAHQALPERAAITSAAYKEMETAALLLFMLRATAVEKALKAAACSAVAVAAGRAATAEQQTSKIRAGRSLELRAMEATEPTEAAQQGTEATARPTRTEQRAQPASQALTVAAAAVEWAVVVEAL